MPVARTVDAILLLTAHRDQPGFNAFRLVSGLRSRSFRTYPTPSRTCAQWSPVGYSLRHRCGGSAGFSPASQFSRRPRPPGTSNTIIRPRGHSGRRLESDIGRSRRRQPPGLRCCKPVPIQVGRDGLEEGEKRLRDPRHRAPERWSILLGLTDAAAPNGTTGRLNCPSVLARD
jgi:hypothetical protein